LFSDAVPPHPALRLSFSVRAAPKRSAKEYRMTNRKPIDVQLHDLRAICIGFVNFPPGEEGSQLALDLTERWNPLLFRELSKENLKIEISAFSASSVNEVVGFLKEKSDNNYPDCHLIAQHGRFQMLNRDTGIRTAVDVILGTFCRSKGETPAVIVGDDLTLIPSSDDAKSKPKGIIGPAIKPQATTGKMDLTQAGAPIATPVYPVDQITRGKNNVLAIVSVVIGVAALLGSCLGIIGIFLGPVALITGVIGSLQIKKSDGIQKGGKMAAAGMILGGASVILGIASVLASLILTLLSQNS
jgi:hypothetical protein